MDAHDPIFYNVLLVLIYPYFPVFVGQISFFAWNQKCLLVKRQFSDMQPMVLVYLPTWLGDFVRANVGKYSSTMEHMGFGEHRFTAFF